MDRSRSAELEDELEECRICRQPSEATRPLFHPCKCSGSIKYTHEDCLVHWLAQSGSSRCELCGHSFRFEPQYQPNTPQALPTDELIVGLANRARRAVLTAARVLLVLFVWLFLLPLGTCWTWYAFFIKSLSQLPGLIASRGVSGIVTDAFYGCLLSSGIVFVFLGVSSLRDYVRHMPDDGLADPNAMYLDGEDLNMGHHHQPDHPHHHHGPLGNEHEQANHHAEGTEDGANGVAVNNGAARRIPPVAGQGEQPARYHAAEGGEQVAVVGTHGENGLGVVTGDTGDDEEPLGGVGVNELERAADSASDVYSSDLNEEVVAEVDALALDMFHNDPIGAENDGEDGVNEVDDGDEGDELAASDSDASSVIMEGPYADHMFADPDAAEVPVEGIDEAEFEDANDDHDGHENGEGGALFGLFELDPDEVPLEEMVGLRGHLRQLFDNAGTVLMSNGIFLFIFTLVPLLVGRLALRIASLQTIPVGNVSYVSAFLSALAGKSPIAQWPVTNSAIEKMTMLWQGEEANVLEEVAAAASVSTTSSAVVAEEPIVSYVDNLFVVLLGYGVISLGAFLYVIVNSLLRSRYPRLDTPMTRQIVRALRYLATVFKCVILILFEFGIFPLGCGWWLDMCTLGIVGSTLESRSTVCREAPWGCTLGHWFIGLFFMVHVSLFVSLLREVLRPQLLWFLRNPDDPDFHPFREMVEKPLSRHARRILLSASIYAPLIVATVYVPSQACLLMLPNVFPFNFSNFSRSFVDIPFGNLMIVPLMSLFHHTRPGMLMRLFVRSWVVHVSRLLGIQRNVVQAQNGTEQQVHGENADDDAAQEGNGGVDDADEGDDELFAPFEDTEVEGEHDRRGFEAVEEEFVDAEEEPVQDIIEGIDPDAHAVRPVGAVNSEQDDVVEAERGNTENFLSVRARGIFMLVLAWLTLVLLACVVLSVPTLMGRGLLAGVGLYSSHDLHAYGLGFYILLASGEVVSRAHRYLSQVDAATALRLVLPYVLVFCKSMIHLMLWLGFMPLVAGLLVELTITVPLRTPVNESPYFYLYQDWALGMLIMKVWSRIALAGGFDTEWRERMERAREGGFLGLGQNFERTLREVIWPLLGTSTVALAVPYAFARGALPMLGASLAFSSYFYRYIYMFLVIVYLSSVTSRYAATGLRALHDSIRDDKYLVGRRLYNYG